MNIQAFGNSLQRWYLYGFLAVGRKLAAWAISTVLQERDEMRRYPVLARLALLLSAGGLLHADGLNLAAGSGSTLTVAVPDGGMTLMLLGGALAGLEALRRRFRG